MYIQIDKDKSIQGTDFILAMISYPMEVKASFSSMIKASRTSAILFVF
jgi:hypothetical protein